LHRSRKTWQIGSHPIQAPTTVRTVPDLLWGTNIPAGGNYL
jgi:hypothetical protein